MEDLNISTVNINQRAQTAAKDAAELECLLMGFQPYLRSCASKYAWGSQDRFEEFFSVSVYAFYEAVQSYDHTKGHFFPFVNSVIRRRLIDCIRKTNKKRVDTVPLESEDMDSDHQSTAAMQRFNLANQHRDLLLEIEQFKAELSGWGSTLDILIRQSPKHSNLRKTCQSALENIFNHAEIIQTIQLKRYFPIKKISEVTGLSPKKLERLRMFIIASIIIRTGDYVYLSEYVRGNGNDRRQYH